MPQMIDDRDAGEPFYTFKKIHEDFFSRLKTDERMVSEYRIDTWSMGRFDMRNLPVTGIHARYQPLRISPLEETISFYAYRTEVIVWLLINEMGVEIQYDLATYYLARIMEIFTDRPDDWSLNGIVTDVKFTDAGWAQDWNERRNSMMLCSITFAIYADIERMHTQSS